MNDTKTNQSDHDLLVVLNERVGNVIDEMRLLRDDTARRLDRVEQTKVDKIDFEKQVDDSNARFEAVLKKLSWLSMVVYIGMGAIGVIEFIISYVIPLLKK